MKKKIILLLLPLLLNGCALLENKHTQHPNNACKMLKENDDWLDSTYASYKKWGVPISVQLAFIRKESSFNYNARPIKKRGFFFDDYQSTAHGFSQALNGTWSDYKRETNNSKANRTSFEDSTDFIGWYLHKISKKINVKKNDSYNLYLAYHEGINGYKKKNYKKKRWLLDVAKNVKMKSQIYSRQIKKCDF